MKFRFTLYFSLMLLSILTVSFALGVLIKTSSQELLLEWQSKTASVAATTAAQIDGNLLKQIQSDQDVGSPAYNQILQTLRKARDANRRDDIYIRYLYTERPDPQNPEMLVFGIDAEESPKDKSQIGDPDIAGVESFVLDHLNEVYGSNTVVKDQWGEWIAAYAPVYDDEKKYVGTVGASISADIVRKYSDQLFLLTLPSFFTCLFLAAILAAILSNKISASLRAIYKATQQIAKGDLEYRIELKTKDEFGAVAQAINTMAEGLAEQQAFKTGMAHYIDKPVLDKLSDHQTKLEGERRKITLLFADIRDFTHFAENTPPETVVSLLNEYFTVMLNIISQHNGTLDKFIGDAILAKFGFSGNPQNQELNAVKAAIKMQEALISLGKKWAKENLPQFQCGIGIDTGETIIGSIGSENERLDYTAIGDTVSTANQLENFTKKTPHHILISERTFKGLNNQIPTTPLGPTVLSGKTTPIDVYAVQTLTS